MILYFQKYTIEIYIFLNIKTETSEKYLFQNKKTKMAKFIFSFTIFLLITSHIDSMNDNISIKFHSGIFKNNNVIKSTTIACNISESLNTITTASSTAPSFFISNLINNNQNNKFKSLKTVQDKSKKSISLVQTSKSTRGNPCENPENPDDEYLEGLLSEYQTFFRKYQETILKNNIDSNLISQNNKHHSVMESNHFIEQSQCTIQERNTYTLNQASLCPWKYVIKQRFDRYPLLRTEVKCTCDKCTTYISKKFPENMYGCMPVLKPFPVLLRGECHDGFYNWTPTTEEVNVACVCAHKPNWGPLPKY